MPLTQQFELSGNWKFCNMRVILICTGGKSEIAGHHFSVRDIAAAFEASDIHVDIVLIVSDRNQKSAAFQQVPHHKFETGTVGLAAVSRLNRLIKTLNPDAVLCFDEFAVRIAILATPFKRELIIAVKPGWVNSNTWTNGVQKFILFTKENFDFYKRTKRYEGVELFYIPNRVAAPAHNELIRGLLIQSIPKLKHSSIIVMCPVRIDTNKGKIIESAIQLHRELSENQSVELVIIGANQHPYYLEQLKRKYGDHHNIHFCCENFLVTRLSEVIGAADIVVAAGRTVAEALLLGKTTYVVQTDGELPALVGSDNFQQLHYSNFTGRSKGNQKPDTSQLIENISTTAFDLAIQELGVMSGVKKYRAVILSPAKKVSSRRLIITYFASALRVIGVLLRRKIKLAKRDKGQLNKSDAIKSRTLSR